MAVGSLLNPNLDIEDLIDEKSNFHFLVKIGKNYINAKLQLNEQPNDSNIHIVHKRGDRRTKDNQNEFEMWLKMVKPLDQKKHDRFYHYWLKQITFPKLREIALSACCFPTSSTDCERLFSIAKYVLGLNRCNISRENTEMAVLLYANYEITKNAVGCD